MELRNCSVKHFIQTMRGGLVIKACNTYPDGRPLRTKNLKDIYDSEDARRPQKSPSGSVFNRTPEKRKGQRSLVADRTLWKVKPEPDDGSTTSAGDNSDSDLDDATTLTQLKNRLLTKKRKCVSTDKKPVEDESDLNEPLIKLKQKRSKAPRAKRRCLSPSVSSSVTEVLIKCEENLVSEGSQQAGVELTPLIRVKNEVPDAEQLGSQNEMPTASSAGHSEVLNSGMKTVLPEYEREPLSNVNRYEQCVTNEISYDHLEYAQPSFMLSRDEVSIGLETPESDCEESLGSALEEITKQNEIPDSDSLVTSCSNDPNADVFCDSSSSSAVEDMPEECGSGCQVSDMVIDDCITPPQGSRCVLSEDKAEADVPSEDMHEESSSGCQVLDLVINGCITPPERSSCVLLEDNAEEDFSSELHKNDSLNIPDKNYVSHQGSMTSSAKENSIFLKDDTIADEEKLSTSSFDTALRNDIISEGHAEDELLKALDKQKSEFAATSTENEYSFEDKTCGNSDTISKPEQHQPPERLFSTRKAFSPSSEEQLCLAMNCVEIWDDSNQKIDSECKGKLFEIQTEKKPSSLRSEVQYEKRTVKNHRLPGQVNRRKVVISGRCISKRQIAKGNLEGPRFSRNLPNLSTGCTSVQDCSESAVAFSQRQMHDMESVAVKLMNELQSMKDIVEQKLLFEAYRNASLKNDADEVKSAINNATRAEEMAKKWMSMMARDCNRFCKIMKMTPDSKSSSKDALPKGERKIMFADEAGGKLCHVRLFDDHNNASPASNDVGQQDHQMQSGCLKASTHT